MKDTDMWHIYTFSYFKLNTILNSEFKYLEYIFYFNHLYC